MSSLTVVTDSSPASVALARWLLQRAKVSSVVDALNSVDVAKIVAARRRSVRGERVVVIGGERSVGDVDSSAARAAAAAWLDDMPPIEARTAGAARIETLRAAGKAGAEAIDSFLSAVAPVRPRLQQAKRGRPRGRDPFSGAGFDVTLSLLLEPERRWTERGLAEATGRVPSLVHKSLQELARRGYLARVRGATTTDNAEALRRDLLAAWRAKVGVVRPIRRFSVARGVDPATAVFEAARRTGATALLAGPSAATGAAKLLGQPLTVYLSDDPGEVLAGDLEERPQIGDVGVWQAPENGVFLSPRRAGRFAGTNHVVTWLDLMLMGTDRAIAAATTFWESQQAGKRRG